MLSWNSLTTDCFLCFPAKQPELRLFCCYVWLLCLIVIFDSEYCRFFCWEETCSSLCLKLSHDDKYLLNLSPSHQPNSNFLTCMLVVDHLEKERWQDVHLLPQRDSSQEFKSSSRNFSRLDCCLDVSSSFFPEDDRMMPWDYLLFVVSASDRLESQELKSSQEQNRFSSQEKRDLDLNVYLELENQRSHPHLL